MYFPFRSVEFFSIFSIGLREQTQERPIWEFPEMGVPQSSSISIGFSLVNHPFFGYPPWLRKPPYFIGKSYGFRLRFSPPIRWPNCHWRTSFCLGLCRAAACAWFKEARRWVAQGPEIKMPGGRCSFSDLRKFRRNWRWKWIMSISKYPYNTYKNLYIYIHMVSCIYIYIWLVVYIYTYIYIYTWLYTNIHVCINICVYIYI